MFKDEGITLKDQKLYGVACKKELTTAKAKMVRQHVYGVQKKLTTSEIEKLRVTNHMKNWEKQKKLLVQNKEVMDALATREGLLPMISLGWRFRVAKIFFGAQGSSEEDTIVSD
jgi:hypothetical protein